MVSVIHVPSIETVCYYGVVDMVKLSQIAALSLALGTAGFAHAALFQYNFINQPGDQISQPPELVNTNIIVTDLTRGPGLTPSN